MRKYCQQGLGVVDVNPELGSFCTLSQTGITAYPDKIALVVTLMIIFDVTCH